MMRAFPIGRPFGIQLDVHASWLPIFALVTATIANAHPVAELGAGGAAYGVAAVASLVLFASVVAHEFAHALTARRFGVHTRSIALFLFGGVALLEAEPPGPLADAAVALAGPAASAAIAALAYGAMHLVDAVVPVQYADAAASVLAYVTVANAALALFNVIPAYPMDGGRVLRAAIWQLRGDRDGATAHGGARRHRIRRLLCGRRRAGRCGDARVAIRLVRGDRGVCGAHVRRAISRALRRDGSVSVRSTRGGFLHPFR